MTLTTIQRFLVVVFASICVGLAQADDSSEAIAGCNAYRDALLKNDADSAWNAIDSKTQEYYASMGKLALGASRQEIKKLDMMTKFAVLRCRVEFKKEVLAKMSGRDFFSEGVKRGWISRSSAESLKGLVVISTDQSSATLALPSQPKTPVIYMTKQGGGWKVALWHIFESGNQALQKAARENGFTDDEFVVQLLDTVSDTEFDDALWDGPAKNEGEKGVTDQPATAPDSKPEGIEKPKPESEPASR